MFFASFLALRSITFLTFPFSFEAFLSLDKVDCVVIVLSISDNAIFCFISSNSFSNASKSCCLTMAYTFFEEEAASSAEDSENGEEAEDGVCFERSLTIGKFKELDDDSVICGVRDAR